MATASWMKMSTSVCLRVPSKPMKGDGAGYFVLAAFGMTVMAIKAYQLLPLSLSYCVNDPLRSKSAAEAVVLICGVPHFVLSGTMSALYGWALSHLLCLPNHKCKTYFFTAS